MEADWYEDPLGRFDGRFFDGEHWTAEVSDAGSLRIDPDFASVNAENEDLFDVGQSTPAVEPIAGSSRREISTSTAESPARVVAVLDESLISQGSNDAPAAADTRQDAARSPKNSRWRWLLAGLLVVGAAIGLAVFASRGDDEPAVEPAALDEDQEARVEDLVDGGLNDELDPDDIQELEGAVPEDDVSDDAAPEEDSPEEAAPEVDEQDEPEATEPDATEPDATEPDATEPDATEPDATEPDPTEPEIDRPEGAVDSSTTFDDEETLALGSLQIVNAESLLAALGNWHQDFVADTDVILGPDARCWLAERGGAADLNVYCGPVGFNDDVALYDVVPLDFEDVADGQVVQPVLDAVETDIQLPRGVTLIEFG